MIGRRILTTARPLITRGLVARWPLSASSGTSAVDISGNGKHGTLTNMSVPACWVPGLFGNAIDFDGIDDYISIPAISLGTVHTCCCWINPDAQVNTYTFGGILGQPSSSTGALNVCGNPATMLEYTTGVGGYYWTAPSVISGWHHFATVRNGLSVAIYFDGELKAGTGSLPVNDAATPIYIGRRNFADVSYNGRLQDLRLYTQLLTAAEIMAIARGRG